MPIRYRNALLAFVWLLTSEGEVDEDQAEVLRRTADAAAMILHREQLLGRVVPKSGAGTYSRRPVWRAVAARGRGKQVGRGGLVGCGSSSRGHCVAPSWRPVDIDRKRSSECCRRRRSASTEAPAEQCNPTRPPRPQSVDRIGGRTLDSNPTGLADRGSPGASLV